MKHKLLFASTLILSTTILGISSVALSDSDGDDDDRGRYNRPYSGKSGYTHSGMAGSQYDPAMRSNMGRMPGVKPVNNPMYLSECGSCHFPYQPGLLPARSWSRVMDGLDNHFGENAELPTEDNRAIRDYLLNNSADGSQYKRSVKIMNSLRSGDTPLRISETPYFIKKHDELTVDMVKNNPKVGSFSKCEACHTQAASGSFSEREIQIPNFGAWEEKEEGKEEKERGGY